MSEVDAGSVPSKPFLPVVSASELDGPKTRSLDPLASVREHLERYQGWLAMDCGCLLRVHPEALKTLATRAIVEALCDSVGNCSHRPTYH
jgi:hypothetical protein